MKLRLKLLKMSLKSRIRYLFTLLKHYLKYPLYWGQDALFDTKLSHMESIKVKKLHAYANFIEQVNAFYLILSAYRAYARDAMANPEDYDILHYRFAFVQKNIQECISLLENFNMDIPEELVFIISNSKVNALVNDENPYDYLVYLHSLCSEILVI